MSSRALEALLALLADEARLREAERIVRAMLPEAPQLCERTRLRSVMACGFGADAGLAFVHEWYASLVMAGIDREGPPPPATAEPTYVAYLGAALAARAGRLQAARRWLVAGHAEAEADGLGAEEVAVLVAAIRTARESASGADD